MDDEFVVVGFKAKQFFMDLNSYMETEEKTSGGTAVEIPLKKPMELSSDESKVLKAANFVIGLIPIKLFPALRYNVDECWDGVETWYSASQYRKELRSMVDTSAKISWVLTGIEGMSVTNNFLDREVNGMIKNPPDDFDIKASYKDVLDTVKRFLREIDDIEFLEENSKETYYLCFDKMEAGKYQVGEKAVEFWIRAPYNGMEILK